MGERAFHCSSKQAVVSILFKKGKKDNPNFAWQKEAAKKDGKVEIDLSKMIDNTFSASNTMLGYVGSETRPPCTVRFCWLVSNTVFELSEEQFNFFV